MLKEMALALVALSVLPGCFKEKILLNVHADRSGKIHVSQTCGESISALHLIGTIGRESEGACAHRALVDELACWNGIVGWRNEQSSVKDGIVSFEADGYFADLNALGRSEPGMGDQRFGARSLKADELEIRWTFKPTPAWTGDPYEKCCARVRMLEGFELTGEISVPGPVTHAETATAIGERGLAWTLASGEVLANEIRDYDKRIAAGELTADEAAAKLHASYAERQAVVRCRVTESAETRTRFGHRLEAVRKAYVGSPLEAEVEARKHERTPARIDESASYGVIR